MHNLTYWKSYLLLAFIGIIISGTANAQDPMFSQFYANPIYLNPALAGSNGCPRIALNYRNQWPSLSGTFVTYSASYDQYFKKMSGGIGVIVTHDQMGKNTINASTLSFIYSYHLKVSRKFSFMFGAKATWNQKFLDWNKLTFGDMIDPRRGFIYQTGDQVRGGSKGFFDVSAGLVGFTKHFYFGLAAYHLNRPNESLIIGDSKMPMRFVAHAGAEIPLGAQSKYNNTASISPSIIYQYQQGFMEFNIGTYIKYGIFQVGFWFRNRDAFISTIGINTGMFKIGYSYDVTVSKLTNQSGGSHEVSLGLNLNCKTKPTTFRTISCPSF
jgi:type IX secretion system PorP/SprF family membrane protein